MNFGDIYALVLKEYPDILTVDEMSKALGVSTKTGYQLHFSPDTDSIPGEP